MPFRWLICVSLAAMLAASAGCAMTPRQYWDSLKGEGFPGWNESMGGGFRGDATEAKPSGFFTDRRSEQIERSLGGGF